MTIVSCGGCHCGAVPYESASYSTRMFNCHCLDCQRIGGGPFLPILVVALSAFRLTRGAIRHYSSIRLNGRQNVRGFCPQCGASLTVGEDADANRIGIIASSLDDPAVFKPALDIFVCDAQPWSFLDPRLPKFETYRSSP